ncbi:hypothetical protein [Roseivirga sp.]|uniref:hypothetical protein n=1 Tax=Roseivirga sp. TaxID=1964215 RepID=UPI002B271504|nr:hypothetical protein [Roseivirga sp.]
MNLKNFWSFFLLIGLFSCGGSPYYKELSQLLKQHEKSIQDYEYIAVINVDACISCMDIVKKFLHENNSNPQLLTVLVSASSKKINLLVGSLSEEVILRDVKMESIYDFELVDMKPVIYSVYGTEVEQRVILLTDLLDGVFFYY